MRKLPMVRRSAAGQYQPILKHELSTPDARRSRPVSHDEFQQLAAQGHQAYSRIASKTVDTSAMDNNWDNLTQHAYEQTRQPWGGATISSRLGKPLKQGADAYALSVKEPGTETMSIHPDSSPQDFHKAMTAARQQFAGVLSRPKHHLGVFRDEDKGTIDFDPVYVTKNPQDIETIGSYTRNVGGAYHFKSGDGFWPPHVAEQPQV